ncbi:MAG: toxic anion resistance protein [Methanobrevibacter sp. CfCl-M3]
MTTEFSLNVNEIKEEAENTLKTEEKKIQENPKMMETAEKNAVAIFKADFDNPNERANILKPLDDFGKSTMTRSTSRNKLLSTRFVDFEKGGDDAAEVGNKLSDLGREMKDLDPGMLDFTKEGILGKIFNPVRRYFDRYKKAEAVIDNIIKSLDIGSKTLQNDNTTLFNEETYLRDVTKQLMTDIELGKMMDEAIEAQIRKAELEYLDKEKIRFVREEILFPLRQRIMDMQQMIVVNQQGIVSLNVVQRNNKELIRGVDRAKNVTVTALRTGVMLASALYNQKIVLKKIQTLNETTESIIESTSRMLREQGSEIHRQSMETMISPEVLKASFADAIAAIEEVSRYKEEALPKMQQTINTFQEMATEGQKVVDRIELNTTNALK